MRYGYGIDQMVEFPRRPWIVTMAGGTRVLSKQGEWIQLPLDAKEFLEKVETHKSSVLATITLLRHILIKQTK